ncbi:MAG: nucleoside:proton symporter [Alphaproteobacteria bacterium]|nr:nucleoside:proton symporter [Alphaproteobacteria bacterium]
MRGVLGFFLLLVVAWALGERPAHARRIPWRTVAAGLGLQVVLALLLLRFPPASRILLVANRLALALQQATDHGTAFVFGYLGGGALPFTETSPGASFILAFKVLPLVLIISALSSLLYYWGVLQAVTRAFAWVLRRFMGISGALALGAAVHIYVGMIEAPLLIRPYLAHMQRGELFALMSCGMAGVAGTVMVVYATMLAPVIPDALGNILICSVISTPAALAVAAVMLPFGPGEDSAQITVGEEPTGAFDALVKGTRDGVGPLVGIVSVLLVTVSLVALVNMALAQLPGGVTLQGLFAILFRPVMWLIGVPWAESAQAAVLMGTKTVLNEFVAYLDLAKLPEGALGPQARTIVTYALCGFANFGSMGILVGGLGAMVPERRREITALGLRSILSGTIATCMSGALAGLLVQAP